MTETFIGFLVEALAAGSIAVTQDTATQAVRDAYAGIHKYITDQYATVRLAELEKDPQSKPQRLVAQEKLEQAGAENDLTLPGLAASLVEALKSQGLDAANFAGVNLEDIRAGIDIHVRGIAAGITV